MELVFKRATEEDWETVLFLEKSASGDKFFFPYLTEGEVKADIKKSSLFIIQLDGKNVGKVSYVKKSPDCARLEGLIVHPDYRRKGIATKAVEFVVNQLKGMKRIELAVHPENTQMIKTYAKFGFRVEGRTDNYFGDGTPRLILAKIA